MYYTLEFPGGSGVYTWNGHYFRRVGDVANLEVWPPFRRNMRGIGGSIEMTIPAAT